MKNFKKIILVLISISLFAGCSNNQVIQKNNNGFFAWMDAYIAIEEGSSNSIAATLFFENRPFSKNDVTNISFKDINNDVKINNFMIEDIEQPIGKYSSYGITLDFTANKVNLYETSGVIITLKSNKTIEYSIGKWVIDVDKSNEELVNTWNSPAATSNAEIFPYEYLISSNAKITKLYYGNEVFISDDEGIIDKGTIDISKEYQSPIVYIKSKVIVVGNQNESTNYGKGTYCGALSLSDEVIKISEKHNN